MYQSVKEVVSFLIGPTASGKTAAAIQLAQRLAEDGKRTAVLCADSRQVYAGMNVGTAKPLEAWRDEPHSIFTPEAVDGIDHYLFNIRRPDRRLTLAEWLAAARAVVARLLAQDVVPIVVGGTMLYADSLALGYELPAVPARPALRARLARESAADLYMRLLRDDPEAQAFVEPHHKQHIIRALEVLAVTHKPFSELRRSAVPAFRPHLIGLFPPWENLSAAIERRARAMLAEGLLEEIERLLERVGPVPLLDTLNYRQAQQVLRGELTADEAVVSMARQTRRYARRQLSWWRGRQDVKWYTSPADLDAHFYLPGGNGR